MVRGGTLGGAVDALLTQGPPAYQVGVVLWIPAMVAQFLLVPVPLQVLWVSAFAFCWQVWLSWSVLGAP